jgi:hypothetical protein
MKKIKIISPKKSKLILSFFEYFNDLINFNTNSFILMYKKSFFLITN